MNLRHCGAPGRSWLPGALALTAVAAWDCLPWSPGASRAHAQTTYYMSPSGSDSNNGSIARPWQTLRPAMSQMKPGDTLHPRGGRYDPDRIIWTKSGAPGLPITIKAYPGERVIFDYSPGYSTVGIKVGHTARVSYVVFDGIEFTGTFGGYALQIWNAAHITVRNCYFHDLRVIRTGALHVGWGATPTTNNIVIEKNRFVNFGQTEYDHALYLSGGVENAIVRNNYFGGFNAGVPLQNNAKDRPISRNNLIYNNIVILTQGPSRMASYVANNDNISFYHNTFYVKWDSSTSYYRNQLIRMVSLPEGAKRGKFWDNVVYHIGNTDPGKLIYGANSTYNLFYPQADPDDAKYAVVADPKFVDLNAGNFRLRSDSPAIDRGLNTGAVRHDHDGKARPRGSGYDIGAFEY